MLKRLVILSSSRTSTNLVHLRCGRRYPRERIRNPSTKIGSSAKCSYGKSRTIPRRVPVLMPFIHCFRGDSVILGDSYSFSEFLGPVLILIHFHFQFSVTRRSPFHVSVSAVSILAFIRKDQCLRYKVPASSDFVSYPSKKRVFYCYSKSCCYTMVRFDPRSAPQRYNLYHLSQSHYLRRSSGSGVPEVDNMLSHCGCSEMKVAFGFVRRSSRYRISHSGGRYNRTRPGRLTAFRPL